MKFVIFDIFLLVILVRHPPLQVSFPLSGICRFLLPDSASMAGTAAAVLLAASRGLQPGLPKHLQGILRAASGGCCLRTSCKDSTGSRKCTQLGSQHLSIDLRTLFPLTAFRKAPNPKSVQNLPQPLFLRVPVRRTELSKLEQIKLGGNYRFSTSNKYSLETMAGANFGQIWGLGRF